MFYHGSLQDGISTAVGQQKLVLCFVTGMSLIPCSVDKGNVLTCAADESEEGVQWETEFLTDDTVGFLDLQINGLGLVLLSLTAVCS